jgi:hypothetical protein
MLEALAVMEQKELEKVRIIKELVQAAWTCLPYLPENDDENQASLRAALHKVFF